jgi:hypothetical protein
MNLKAITEGVMGVFFDMFDTLDPQRGKKREGGIKIN